MSPQMVDAHQSPSLSIIVRNVGSSDYSIELLKKAGVDLMNELAN